MIFLANNVQLHQIRGTAPVSIETAKRQCNFFTLNSHRPSIDYDVRLFSIQTTLRENGEYALQKK